MTSSVSVLQLHHREAFERTVSRALLAGAAAGLLHLLAARAGLVLPLALLAVVGVVLAAARGDRLDRLLVGGLGVALPALPFLLELSAGWSAGLAAAAGGALLVRAHLNGLGAEGQLDGRRPAPGHYLLAAALGAGLVQVGLEVAGTLAAWLRVLDAPAAVPALAGGAALGLFLGLGAVAAHLGLSPDPVEARCEALLPGLSGELQGLAVRALALYRQCLRLLARLPREPAQEALAHSLGALTQECVELAAAWTGVEAEQEALAHEELAQEARELAERARASGDALVSSQLALAAGALQEELARLADWRLQHARLVARLRAQVALLSRTRGALLSARSGQVQLRATELEALLRRLRTLTAAQQVEAEALAAACDAAPLAQPEAQRA